MKTLRLLLSKGPNAKAIDEAFVVAAEGRHHEGLRILADHGADVKMSGSRALRAVTNGGGWSDAEVETTVRFLLDLGAEVDGKDHGGQTPLFLAARRGYPAVVHTLLERGANVNADCDCDGVFSARNWTALQIAAKHGRSEVVEALLAKGADPNQKNSEGSTALHMAKDLRTTQALLAKGADVNASDKKGMTPIMHGDAKMARALLDGGADVNAKDKDGWTALMYAAAYWDHEGKVRTLLERGADVNAQSVKGGTALIIAAANANEGVVRVLLESGARVNETLSGKTALDFAQENVEGPATTETVRLLKEAAMK